MKETEALLEEKEIREMYQKTGQIKKGFQHRTTFCKKKNGEIKRKY
jgi:hypothetical protein